MSSALFRFMGALGRNIIVANTFGSFGLLTIFVLGGFILARGKVKKKITSRFFNRHSNFKNLYI